MPQTPPPASLSSIADLEPPPGGSKLRHSPPPTLSASIADIEPPPGGSRLRSSPPPTAEAINKAKTHPPDQSVSSDKPKPATRKPLVKGRAKPQPLPDLGPSSVPFPSGGAKLRISPPPTREAIQEAEKLYTIDSSDTPVLDKRQKLPTRDKSRKSATRDENEKSTTRDKSEKSTTGDKSQEPTTGDKNQESTTEETSKTETAPGVIKAVVAATDGQNPQSTHPVNLKMRDVELAITIHLTINIPTDRQ